MEFMLRKKMYVLRICYQGIWTNQYVFETNEDAWLYIRNVGYDEDYHHIYWNGVWCNFGVTTIDLLVKDV